VILAAGKSTRMRSRLPKPLHRLCGLPLTRHVVEACRKAGVERIVVVVGHEGELVKHGLGDDVEYSLQAEQLGTGHAAMCARQALGNHDGPVLLLAGDVPLIRAETLGALVAAASGPVAGAMLTAMLDDPTGYGRVIRDTAGRVVRIVEQKDATTEEAAVREWNPSVYCFQSSGLWDRLGRIRSNNAQGEYYLTDLVGLTVSDGEAVATVSVADHREVLGVNSRAELAECGAVLRRRVVERLMESGVTVVDPATAYIDVTVTVGQDTVIEPQTHLCGRTTVGEDCVVGPLAIVRDSAIGDRCTVVASQIVASQLGNGVRVGPFANLRPGCRLADGVKIGDFVELKNATLGERVSAGHLTYIGDADIGAHTNIGAGTITCNYDGFAKHRTVVGEDAFIGSDTILVAPVTVGDRTITAAGSTITDDVPPDALGIARSPQSNRKDWARRWRDARAKREKGRG